MTDITDTAELIRTPFAWESTADEVIAGIELTGKRAIVTGGSSGIGIETARALASAGAEVTLAVRDTAAGQRTAADIGQTTDAPSMHVGRLDLADQASVAAFAANWRGPLDLLVNNAGVMAIPGPGAQSRGLGDADRHQSPRALRARARTTRGARGRRRGADRLAELGRAPALAGRLRRPGLHGAPV